MRLTSCGGSTSFHVILRNSDVIACPGRKGNVCALCSEHLQSLPSSPYSKGEYHFNFVTFPSCAWESWSSRKKCNGWLYWSPVGMLRGSESQLLAVYSKFGSRYWISHTYRYLYFIVSTEKIHYENCSKKTIRYCRNRWSKCINDPDRH